VSGQVGPCPARKGGSLLPFEFEFELFELFDGPLDDDLATSFLRFSERSRDVCSMARPSSEQVTPIWHSVPCPDGSMKLVGLAWA
jgi:hypothetical protein